MRKECARVLDLLRAWAKEVPTDLFESLFVFGSLIYREDDQFEGGDQFDVATSDVDLLAILSPETASPLLRQQALLALLNTKEALELRLLKELKRAAADTPIVSK